MASIRLTMLHAPLRHSHVAQPFRWLPYIFATLLRFSPLPHTLSLLPRAEALLPLRRLLIILLFHVTPR